MKRVTSYSSLANRNRQSEIGHRSLETVCIFLLVKEQGEGEREPGRRERGRATGRVREMNYAAKGREMGKGTFPLGICPSRSSSGLNGRPGSHVTGGEGRKDEVGSSGKARQRMNGRQEGR